MCNYVQFVLQRYIYYNNENKKKKENIGSIIYENCKI